MNLQKFKSLVVMSVFGLVAGICLGASANQSISWTPCACGTGSYTLTVNTFNYGTVAKSPDKPTYAKGESVIVSFTPNADRVFSGWLCTPASHMASGSDQTGTVVFMTANTTLTALTLPNNYTLYCNWDSTKGTVALPSGGQGGAGWFTVPVTSGEQVTLTATPNSGYYTFWQGQWASGDWSGQRYGDSLDVVIGGTHRLAAGFGLTSQYPSMNNLTVNTDGGSAQVYCAGAATASWTSGPYPYNTAIAPGLFSFRVVPDSGYHVDWLSWTTGGVTTYSTTTILSNCAGNTYTAHVLEKIKLNVETQGQGVVTSPGFTYSWNPEPYVYGTGSTLTQNVNANAVTVTPSPCNYWSFDHWEYKNAAGQWVIQTNPIPGYNQPLTVYMNWWTGSGIHVPDGQKTFSAKAVFVEHGVDISVYSTQEGCFAGYAQRATGANIHSFTTGSEVITALINATSTHCSIGNLYIFSHAWLYNSQFGQEHSGGLFGGGDDRAGFYGQKIADDDPEARDLTDLQNAINAGTIRFADDGTLRIFLEGCRIGVTGSTISLPSSFVTQLGSITGRVVVSACAGSSEYALQTNSVKFRSAPDPYEELIDGIYDGWIEDSTQRGIYCTVPAFVFSN